MNGYLRQATASQVRTIGPFIDDTDFKTLENGLTIANTDIVISVNGGADTTKASGGATAHGAGGIYTLTWDATDTATVGELYFSVKVAGALVVFGSYHIIDTVAYDAMFADGATGQFTGVSLAADQAVNVTKISGDSGAADNAEAFFDGTGYAGTNNVIPTVTTLTNLPAITNNWLTAAGIASGALDGKGNWNIGKTGYSLTQTFPSNFSALAITAGGAVTAGTVSDKTGYSLTATTGLGNQTADITGNLSGSVGTVTGTVNADVKKMNGTTVLGTGAAGDLWRG